ncbi:MAG: DMT family transporter [Pseudomonadota bacterium]
MNSPSNSVASIFFMVTGMAILGFIDNVVVLLRDDVGLWQFHLTRSAIAVPVVLALGIALGWRVWPQRFWWVFARSLFLAGAMVIYFGSLGYFLIAAVAAGLFTSPILVMFIDAVWSRRKIGPIRLGAAVLGFAGAMMVLAPDTGQIGWANLMPIAGGLLYAFGSVSTRKWCEGESAVSLLWIYMAQMMVIGAVALFYIEVSGGAGDGFLTRGWVWPSSLSWWLILAQALFSLVGIGFIMQAYLIGEVTYITIFEYAMLIFASIAAYFMFGQAVGPLALTGMAIIIVTGIVIAVRSADA